MDAQYKALFDAGVDRRNTGCEKWDNRKAVFGNEDVIPLWVADTDFAAPREVYEGLAARAMHGAFGYSCHEPEDKQAVIDWMRRRRGVEISEEMISFSPGVVDSMKLAIRTFTKPGDMVAVQTPVYGPFPYSVEWNGCRVYRNPLLHTEDGWKMDLDQLEAGFKQGVKVMLLCNPHNPIGRLWTAEEIEALKRLCEKYGVIVIDDEIHADLTMPGRNTYSLASWEHPCVTLISATKTFNLAALRFSSVIIRDPATREAFHKTFEASGLDTNNLFGKLAQRLAYTHGDEWLDQLRFYLDDTRQAVEEYIASELPMIRVSRLEGTYLMWVDMRALNMEQDALMRFLYDEAKCGLQNGMYFGEEGRGFMRMNIATPRKNVMTALEQLKAALGRRA